ncbi:MAG: hypothetical protein ACI9JK_000871 [Phycisphaerales bacterium]|jgi:hypothetical protein
MVLMGTPSNSFWQRKRTHIYIAVVMLPFLLVFVATRSFVLTPILTSAFESHLNTKVQLSGAMLHWGGVITIDEVTMVATGIEGPASEIVSAEQVEIAFSTSFLFFKPVLLGIEVKSVRLRLAESSENAGEFNFNHLVHYDELLDLQTESDSSFSQPFPPFTLDELVIEIGYMQGSTWVLDYTKQFTLAGLVQNEDMISMQVSDESKQLTCVLEFHPEPMSISAVFEDVQLNDEVFGLLPRTAKTWSNEVNLQGGFDTLDVSWESEVGFAIQAEINTLQFTLPEQHGVPWASYKEGEVKQIHGDSILDVQRGSITYDGTQVMMKQITGSLVPPGQTSGDPLKFSGALRIYDFDSVGKQNGEQWMSSMLMESPFKAVFTINDFSPSESAPGEVRVPLAAAQMLKVFQLQQWNMNAKVRVGREEYKGEVEVEGSCSINAKEGLYSAFPYPLHGIQSEIKFNQNDIQIIELTADGSEDASVLIKGDIYASADDLKVDLELFAGDAPIDNALRGALSEQLASIADKLLDEKTVEKVLGRLEAESDKPFELGGTLDLTLLISHDSNEDSKVDITGSIAIEDIWILHTDFPYPVVLRAGSVILDHEGLHVPADSSIKFQGYGGGRGYVAGSILFLEDGTALPALAIKLENETITSALVSAVVDSAGEENGLAAGILEGLGLTATIKVDGKIIGSDTGDIDSSFTVSIENGTSTPNIKLANAIEASGPFWPDGFQFTELQASLSIHNGVVELRDVTCQSGEGTVQANLTINKGDFDMNIIGVSLPISSKFVEVLPESASNELANAWRLLEPTGLMDAVIRMNRTDDESTLNMSIVPKQLLVSALDRSTEMRLSSGTVQVEGTNVFLNSMQFELNENGVPQGVIDISGEVLGSEDEHEFSITAQWDDAVLDSPFTRAITAIVGGDSGIEYYDAMKPDGKASATLFASGDSEEVSYSIDVVPETLTATFHKRRASAVFEAAQEPAKNVIHFYNDGIHFDHLLGTLGQGAVSIDGEISSNEYIEGRFDLTWEGPTGDESLFAILPSIVGDTLIDIEMKGGYSSMPNAEVSFYGENWSNLAVHFNGDITQENVSLDVGIVLEQIQGVTHVEGEYSKEKLSAFELSMAFEELTTLGRKVTNVAGSLELDSETERFVFENVRGESVTGSVTVDGWLGLDGAKEYELEVLVSGVDLAAKEGSDIAASLEGELQGWVSIAGTRGDKTTRRGMGKIIVENGHLEIDPLTLTTMRILQLALPSVSTVEGAEIDLYIQGDDIILEDISLQSSDSGISPFVLEGEGSIDFETMEIYARLHPRAGLPIIRDIAGVLNDRFYSIDVTGKLLNPEVSIVPLPFLSSQDK